MRIWHYNSKPVDIKRRVFGVDDLALILGMGAMAGGAYGMGSMSKKKDSGVNLPAYYEDPYYTQSQGQLFPFYSDLLAGKPNSYYAPIGEWGGKELEDLIGLSTRDITNSVSSDLAGKNMSRSGLAAEAIGSKVGDLSTKLRWDDYTRALTGRMNLLNIGSTGMGNVRSAAITNQANKNSYNLGSGQLQLGIQQNEQKQSDSEAAMWGEILGSGVSAGTNLYGYNMLSDAMKSGSVPTSVTGKMGSIDVGGQQFNWDEILDSYSKARKGG